MKRRVTIAEAFEQLPREGGTCFARMFEHGSLQLELYAPRGHDPQTPHTRDEAYVVVSGTGTFCHGGQRDEFGPGDFLFVEAGLEHRSKTSVTTLRLGSCFTAPKVGET